MSGQLPDLGLSPLSAWRSDDIARQRQKNQVGRCRKGSGCPVGNGETERCHVIRRVLVPWENSNCCSCRMGVLRLPMAGISGRWIFLRSRHGEVRQGLWRQHIVDHHRSWSQRDDLPSARRVSTDWSVLHRPSIASPPIIRF